MSDPQLERFKGILATIATMRPGLPIEEALVTAAEVEKYMVTSAWAPALDAIGREIVPDDDTAVDLAAEWCRKQPIIVDYVVAGKHINAIKEARALSKMGLKAAKDAVEHMRDHLLP